MTITVGPLIIRTGQQQEVWYNGAAGMITITVSMP